MRIRLSEHQARFTASDAIYRALVGGRGAGKSWIGAYDLLKRANRPTMAKRLFGVYAPTYPMLLDSSYRSFLAMGAQLGSIAEVNKSNLRATLTNGAEVLFRSVDDPERARGPNLSGAWLDEASLMQRAAFDIIIACLREAGESGWLSATFTPKGKQHWTYEVFGNHPPAPNTALFHGSTRDNPFLPPEFEAAVRAQYTARYAQQELGGEFIDLERTLAQRAWFDVIPVAPALAGKVRHWDFAATEKSAASSDPDYAAGLLLAAEDGVYTVCHVVRERVGPGAVERLVRQTAEADGKRVAITLEQEPGSSGKLFTSALIRDLAGWIVRAIPASGDKVTRAMPWLAQAEAGNVRLVSGAWNAAWLDEICSFPQAPHDDQVDAMSGAFAALTGDAPRVRAILVPQASESQTEDMWA